MSRRDKKKKKGPRRLKPRTASRFLPRDLHLRLVAELRSQVGDYFLAVVFFEPGHFSQNLFGDGSRRAQAPVDPVDQALTSSPLDL